MNKPILKPEQLAFISSSTYLCESFSQSMSHTIKWSQFLRFGAHTRSEILIRSRANFFPPLLHQGVLPYLQRIRGDLLYHAALEK